MTQNTCGKRTVLIFCAVLGFTLSACEKKAPEAERREDTPSAAEEPLVIELGVGVGPIKFGMSKEELIQAFGQPDKIEAVAPDVVTLDYISSRGLLLGLNPEVGINYIKCYSEAYPGYSHVINFADRTKEGLAMGASRDQVIATYGQPDRTDSKSHFTILYYEDLAADMILTENSLVGIKMLPPR
jgi:hypothetical protein